MKDLKETYLKKYGVWEYVLFLIGLALAGRSVYSIIIADFKTITAIEIGVIILFLCLGILSFAAPLTMLDIARKKAGMETRREKISQSEKSNEDNE